MDDEYVGSKLDDLHDRLVLLNDRMDRVEKYLLPSLVGRKVRVGPRYVGYRKVCHLSGDGSVTKVEGNKVFVDLGYDRIAEREFSDLEVFSA